MAPRESENNVYAKCWGDKRRASWSGADLIMVYYGIFWSGQLVKGYINLHICELNIRELTKE